jgi:hypothetical protein
VIWGVNDWKNVVIKSKAKLWVVKQQSQSQIKRKIMVQSINKTQSPVKAKTWLITGKTQS